MNLAEELRSFVQGEVVDDSETLTRYSHDASLFEIRPQVVVSPKNALDIEQVVEFVRGHADQKLSITARSAATDMSGGPLNESIILDMTPHFNRVVSVGDGQAVTQPGVYYRDFEKATLAKGLLMPSYPASREICTVGGMASNNSGGEKTLTYGETINFVKELKVVLADGQEHQVKPLNKNELDAKMAEQTFEGKLYRDLFQIVDGNYDLIQKARPAVSKNSAGYFLWEVWNRETGIFDMTKVLVGSQGTLGIITEITFRLIQPKKHAQLLVIFLKDINRLGDIINAVLAHKPESFESYDDKTLRLAIRFLPSFAKLLGTKNLLSLGWQFLPELKMVLTGGVPKLVLMAEFTGDDEAELASRTTKAQKDVAQFGVSTRIAATAQEMKKYWTIRRESFNLLRNHLKGKRTAPFIDDIIVLPQSLPQFLPKLEAILAPYHLNYSVAGHAGNGNFHIIPIIDPKDSAINKIIPELSRKVYSLVLEFHGSITGEHNDGLIRSPFLKQMYGPEIYALFEQTKRIFDPNNIFNPGKKVNSDFEYSMKHLRTS